jgi:hypothetical protein
MMLLNFSLGLILPAAVRHWGRLSPYQMSISDIPGSKDAAICEPIVWASTWICLVRDNMKEALYRSAVLWAPCAPITQLSICVCVCVCVCVEGGTSDDSDPDSQRCSDSTAVAVHTEYYCLAGHDTSNLIKVESWRTKSKLLYDWRPVSQYALVSNALVGLAIRYYFLSEWCCLKFAVLFLWSALSDERMGLQFAVQSLNDPSHAELVTIFYCLIWDSPNLEGQVPVIISPRNRVAQLYPRALGLIWSIGAIDSEESSIFIFTFHEHICTYLLKYKRAATAQSIQRLVTGQLTEG